MYDVIIIGMGPSGMSAALYAKRSNMNTLIIEKNSPGGLVNTTNKVENYLGFGSISGPDLAFKMFSHIKEADIPYKIEEVKSITKEENVFKIITPKNEYTSKTVILSSGRQPKVNDFEKTIKNLNISRCAICDAPLYKGKDVLVLGGGDSAVEESIYLSSIANKVYIVNRSDIKRKEELTSFKNIKVLENSVIDDISFDEVYSVKIKEHIIKVHGVFSYIGFEPCNNYLNALNLKQDNGYVVTNDGVTNIDGLFACGDIIKKDVYQISTAVSEGAICGLKAGKYVRSVNK